MRLAKGISTSVNSAIRRTQSHILSVPIVSILAQIKFGNLSRLEKERAMKKRRVLKCRAERNRVEEREEIEREGIKKNRGD